MQPPIPNIQATRELTARNQNFAHALETIAEAITVSATRGEFDVAVSIDPKIADRVREELISLGYDTAILGDDILKIGWYKEEEEDG